MKNVSARWLRNALCSTLVVFTSGAFAQGKPDNAPASATASSGGAADASAPKANDPVPTKEQCLESHREAQQAQNVGKLVHARELARTCTSLVCPGLVVTDCARWLNDLDQRIPSVVFEVRIDGQPNLTASVIADGKRVEEWTRGESLRLDPGEHQFRFELPPHQPITQNILLAEGMRYRAVSAEFKTQSAATSTTSGATLPTSNMPAAPATVVMERPTPVIVYPLLGLGALGAIGTGVFWALGSSKQSDLDKSCKGTCSDEEISSMKNLYRIGDASLLVGALSLTAASVFYLARPERPATTVGFTPLPGGAATFARYQF